MRPARAWASPPSASPCPSFGRTDQWLGAPLPEQRREQAQAELVRRYRRYLHCYGPSTPEHFAGWAGIAAAQAAQALNFEFPLV